MALKLPGLRGLVNYFMADQATTVGGHSAMDGRAARGMHGRAVALIRGLASTHQ